MLTWENNETTSCNECSRKSEMFNYLSPHELDFITKHKYEIKYKKGEILKKQGTHLSHVVSINSGLVKMYIEGYRGKNLILRIINSTNFIGGPGLYFDQKHHYSVMALTETNACFIEVHAIKQIIRTNPEFAAEFIKEISKNTLSTYERLISISQKQIPGRISDALLYLSRDIFKSNIIHSSITKNDLSELAGMTKDSVIKILREFKEDGIIKMDKDIEILDEDKLIKISNVG